LTDIDGNVIWYCTSGQVCEFKNIKRKRSHLVVRKLMNRLSPVISKNKIKHLYVHIRSGITRHIKKVILFLDQRRLKVWSIIFDKRFPHHFGQRRKKLRRI
jgi:ribosomal protein S11